MKRIFEAGSFLLVGAFCVCSTRLSAEPCGTGLQPRGEICISQRMADFIACVEASGGNKKNLYDQIANSVNNSGGGSVSATANGLVVRGSGKVEINKDAEERLRETLSTTYFDGAMESCRRALDASSSSSPPVKPPKQAPPPPPTVTFKICTGEYERACLGHDVYLYCYADVNGWAKNKCQASTVTIYNSYGGNKCGYGMYLVTCVGPH